MNYISNILTSKDAAPEGLILKRNLEIYLKFLKQRQYLASFNSEKCVIFTVEKNTIKSY